MGPAEGGARAARPDRPRRTPRHGGPWRRPRLGCGDHRGTEPVSRDGRLRGSSFGTGCRFEPRGRARDQGGAHLHAVSPEAPARSRAGVAPRRNLDGPSDRHPRHGGRRGTAGARVDRRRGARGRDARPGGARSQGNLRPPPRGGGGLWSGRRGGARRPWRTAVRSGARHGRDAGLGASRGRVASGRGDDGTSRRDAFGGNLVERGGTDPRSARVEGRARPRSGHRNRSLDLRDGERRSGAPGMPRRR